LIDATRQPNHPPRVRVPNDRIHRLEFSQVGMGLKMGDEGYICMILKSAGIDCMVQAVLYKGTCHSLFVENGW
jgi:hypothetical protein